MNTYENEIHQMVLDYLDRRQEVDDCYQETIKEIVEERVVEVYDHTERLNFLKSLEEEKYVPKEWLGNATEIWKAVEDCLLSAMVQDVCNLLLKEPYAYRHPLSLGDMQEFLAEYIFYGEVIDG